MLSTRTTRGLDLSAWEAAFGAPFARGREGALARLERGGFIELEGGFMRMTLKGLELHNAVVLELLGDA